MSWGSQFGPLDRVPLLDLYSGLMPAEHASIMASSLMLLVKRTSDANGSSEVRQSTIRLPKAIPFRRSAP